MVLDFPRLCFLGDLRGEVSKTERLGSKAELGLDIVLEFASRYESTKCCGPKEKVEPIDARERELDGEGRRGIGRPSPKGFGSGGVEAIAANEQTQDQRKRQSI